ncbi:MAG: Uma2 family endonuclease [Desulfatirhabdiaceae bacterium]
MTAQPKPFISVEDYLAQERSGDTRNEYFAGDVFAMAGGSEAHNLIMGNTHASLHAQCRKRDCRVYAADMRVKISQINLYTYPDIAMICGPPQFEDDHRDTLLNPTVIIEILSPSTESYDRGKKFQNYRMIPSLQEYLLISQNARHIDHYIRQSIHHWLFSEIGGNDGDILMPSVESRLNLSDVYEKTDLP